MDKEKKGLGCGGFIVLVFVVFVVYALVNAPPRPEVNQPANPAALTAPVINSPINPNPTAGTAASKYFPGLAAVDLYGNLKKKGFKIETLHGDGGVSGTSWYCKSTEDDCELLASTNGITADQLDNISATVMHTSVGDPKPKARQFLGDIASLPYSGSDPAKARKWIEANVGKKTTTTIGAVKFELLAPSKWVCMLLMTPKSN